MLIIVYIYENCFVSMKKHKKKSKLTRVNLLSVGIVFCVLLLGGFFVSHSFSPVNANNLVFAPSSNIFLKAVKSNQGNYHYLHTKGGKAFPSADGVSPPINVSKGNLIQIHFINEEKNQSGNLSKHNLNIDEFNVHTKDLSYFQSESIIFLADKTGTFDYYCSIHPEMKGTFTVTE